MRISLATGFRKFIRELGVESRTCIGFVCERDPPRSLMFRVPDSQTAVSAPRAHVTSTSRDVIGRDPRVHARSVREQRSKVVVKSDVTRGVSVRREFSRSSTVSKRAADRLFSPLFSHAHPVVSVPYISVCHVHHTREWKRGGGAWRREHAHTHTRHPHHS